VHAGGLLQDTADPAKSVPGGGMIAGIGFVSGRALHGGGQRFGHRGRRHPAHGPGELRVQEIALQNKLPFMHLVESAAPT
jgi:geranyl-CoA carboxylase beta subunit